ncbi:P-II family nitrogen regulator [Plebeiibacterium sediminum]|uniref:P-II family nitrogen regulator n=1 Tax=Plebeiibacterium sediminum TaxID=2992112 RepID=A0AAE3M2L0_9BACT|nr:P-II family nitrogen regulator [Plebeiobacterium sediminum]MCW3785645.1 P-II family nitrogen regulator [Plebeiobacterium sediminum]
MIKAIVRPEKSSEVLKALFEAGYVAVTKTPVVGRGKQRGIKIGDITYDELPKEMLMMVIKAEDKDFAVNTIMEAAKTGNGNFGDGKIFISPVEEAYTISRATKEL